MGVQRWPWFRFYVTAHEDEKIATLSDGEYRFLTRIWALGRQNEANPGWVWLVPGVGIDPKEIATGARCKSLKDPAGALERLAKLQLVKLHEGGVIEIVNWKKLQPPPPPSHTPEARRQQKREERSRKGVARRQDGDTEATGQDVGGRPDGDWEEVSPDVGRTEGEGEERDPPKPPLKAIRNDRWTTLRARLTTEQQRAMVEEHDLLLAEIHGELLWGTQERAKVEAMEDQLFAKWSALVPLRVVGGG